MIVLPIPFIISFDLGEIVDEFYVIEKLLLTNYKYRVYLFKIQLKFN